MLKSYSDKGYAGVVLTDHFSNSGSSFLNDKSLSWADKVRVYSEYIEKAKTVGESLGLTVFSGYENCAQGGREQLVYGIDSDFLINNADIDKKSVDYVCDAVREYGGVTSLAHPFREAFYIDQSQPIYSSQCDCIEVYNFCNKEPVWNKRAYELAISLGKGMTSGSDAHSPETAGNAGIATTDKLSSNKDLVAAIKSESTSLIINGRIVSKSDFSKVL